MDDFQMSETDEIDRGFIGTFLWVDSVLQLIIGDIFEQTPQVVPEPMEALGWLVSEVGELFGAYLDGTKDWDRKRDHSGDSAIEEAGDVLRMLYVFCWLSGINPITAMLEKWSGRGWDWKKMDLSKYGGGKLDEVDEWINSFN